MESLLLKTWKDKNPKTKMRNKMANNNKRKTSV